MPQSILILNHLLLPPAMPLHLNLNLVQNIFFAAVGLKQIEYDERIIEKTSEFTWFSIQHWLNLLCILFLSAILHSTSTFTFNIYVKPFSVLFYFLQISYIWLCGIFLFISHLIRSLFFVVTTIYYSLE